MSNEEKKEVLPILKYPDKKLLTPCDKITEFGEPLEKLFNELMRSLIAQKWGSKLGLAGPQIGITKRICVVNGICMANPEFQPSKAPKDTMYEGCYSLPTGEQYKTERAPYGWAKWQDKDGEWQEQKFNGILAIIIQHEIDHLDGKLCCGDDFPELKVENTKQTN